MNGNKLKGFNQGFLPFVDNIANMFSSAILQNKEAKNRKLEEEQKKRDEQYQTRTQAQYLGQLDPKNLSNTDLLYLTDNPNVASAFQTRLKIDEQTRQSKEDEKYRNLVNTILSNEGKPLSSEIKSQIALMPAKYREGIKFTKSLQPKPETVYKPLQFNEQTGKYVEEKGYYDDKGQWFKTGSKYIAPASSKKTSVGDELSFLSGEQKKFLSDIEGKMIGLKSAYDTANKYGSVEEYNKEEGEWEQKNAEQIGLEIEQEIKRGSTAVEGMMSGKTKSILDSIKSKYIGSKSERENKPGRRYGGNKASVDELDRVRKRISKTDEGYEIEDQKMREKDLILEVFQTAQQILKEGRTSDYKLLNDWLNVNYGISFAQIRSLVNGEN